MSHVNFSFVLFSIPQMLGSAKGTYICPTSQNNLYYIPLFYTALQLSKVDIFPLCGMILFYHFNLAVLANLDFKTKHDRMANHYLIRRVSKFVVKLSVMRKSNHLAGLNSSYISGSLEDTSRSDSNDNFM